MSAITYKPVAFGNGRVNVHLEGRRAGTIYRTETPNGFRWFYRPARTSKIHDGPLYPSIEEVKRSIEGAQ